MMNKQTILITGATGNIGGGAAVALAKRGARVVLLGRRLETLEAEADSIRVALSGVCEVRGCGGYEPISDDTWTDIICWHINPKRSEHPAQRS